MTNKRYILLEVDADRSDELLTALLKRTYIKHVALDRDDRKKLDGCPACGTKFARESVVTVTDEMVEALYRIVQAMKIANSAILYHAKFPKENVRPVDFPR